MMKTSYQKHVMYMYIIGLYIWLKIKNIIKKTKYLFKKYLIISKGYRNNNK